MRVEARDGEGISETVERARCHIKKDCDRQFSLSGIQASPAADGHDAVLR